MLPLVVAAQLLALIAMVAVSAWGWKHVPPGARVRVRSGPTGIDWTISKKTTLVLTPLIGLLIVIATLTLADPANRKNVAGLGLAVMLVFLAAHWSSVKRAGR